MSAPACAYMVKAGAEGVSGPDRVTWEVLYIESLCAPKRIEKFLGIAPGLVMVAPPAGGGRRVLANGRLHLPPHV